MRRWPRGPFPAVAARLPSTSSTRRSLNAGARTTCSRASGISQPGSLSNVTGSTSKRSRQRSASPTSTRFARHCDRRSPLWFVAVGHPLAHSRRSTAQASASRSLRGSTGPPPAHRASPQRQPIRLPRSHAPRSSFSPGPAASDFAPAPTPSACSSSWPTTGGGCTARRAAATGSGSPGTPRAADLAATQAALSTARHNTDEPRTSAPDVSGPPGFCKGSNEGGLAMSIASSTSEPHAETPRRVIELFSQYLNSGNLEGALSLYEPEAVFAPQPGQIVSGLDAIREGLAGFFAIRPQIEGEIQKVLAAENTALVINSWSLT